MTDEKTSIRKRIGDIKSFYNVDVTREVKSDKFKRANGVCCDDKGFLYLTCAQMKKLLIFNDKLEFIKEINLDGKPSYIVCFKGRLFITFGNDKSIGIYDLEGQEIDRLENRLSDFIDSQFTLFAMGAGDESLVLVDFNKNDLHFIAENGDYLKKTHIEDLVFQDTSTRLVRKMVFKGNELFMMDLHGIIYRLNESGNVDVVFKAVDCIIRDAIDFAFFGEKICILERNCNHLFLFDRSTGDYLRWKIDNGNVFRMTSWGRQLLIPVSSHGALSADSKSRIIEIYIS